MSCGLRGLKGSTVRGIEALRCSRGRRDHIAARHGLCQRHSILYEHWFDRLGGRAVYATTYPKRWKRRCFVRWLIAAGAPKLDGIVARSYRTQFASLLARAS